MKNDFPIILVLWPWLSPRHFKRRLPEERHLLLHLVEDLRSQGIRLVPFPVLPSRSVPFPLYEIDPLEWEHALRLWELESFEQWEDWAYQWEHYRSKQKHHLWNRWQRRYLPEIARSLARLVDAGAIRGMIVVTLPGTEEQVETGALEQLASTIGVAAVVHLTLEPPDDRVRAAIPGVRSFHYPNERASVLDLLTSMATARGELYREPPTAAPPLLPDRRREERPHVRPEKAPRLGKLASHAPVPDEVYLGVAVPRALSPGEEFVARFAAYTEVCRSEVRRVFEQEAPSSQPRLDLETCRWHRGARVTVQLDSHHLKVANPVQTFKWNGAWRVLRFDATVLHEVEVKTLILGFRIAVEGLPIIALRPEIELLERGREPKATPRFSFVEEMAPNSAFASYARSDRREVLGRVRSLQIFTGIDVFLDCLSIRPGEQWKPTLHGEIRKRDIFWLFWSRSARDSPWVEWEWRTALAAKSLRGIQPHPLEPADLAPPPNELSQLQFGAMYEWYLSGLRESWLTRRCRALWHRVKSVLRK